MRPPTGPPSEDAGRVGYPNSAIDSTNRTRSTCREIETRMAPRLDHQDQRRDVPRAVVRLRDPHGFDVHHERGQPGHGLAP